MLTNSCLNVLYVPVCWIEVFVSIILNPNFTFEIRVLSFMAVVVENSQKQLFLLVVIDVHKAPTLKFSGFHSTLYRWWFPRHLDFFLNQNPGICTKHIDDAHMYKFIKNDPIKDFLPMPTWQSCLPQALDRQYKKCGPCVNMWWNNNFCLTFIQRWSD